MGSDGLEQRILDAFEELHTASAVSKALDIPYASVKRVLKDNGVELWCGRRRHFDLDAIGDRVISLYELHGSVRGVHSVLREEGLKLDKSKIYGFLQRAGVELKRGRSIGTKRVPERDALIAQGLTLQEIADDVGVTREAIRQYINQSGQYGAWREARGKAKHDEAFLKSAPSRLVSQIRAIALKKAEELGPAHVYALRHQYRQGTTYDYDRILPLFQMYFSAVESGESPTLQELADASGLKSAARAQQVLNAAGLSAFHERKHLSDELRWAIVRGLDVEHFSVADIAFFVGCTGGNICQSYKTESRKRVNGISGPFAGRCAIYFASMIYESLDAGFDLEEAADVVGKPLDVVEYIAENRDDFGKKIIDGLRYMFSDDTIDRPYLPDGYFS